MDENDWPRVMGLTLLYPEGDTELFEQLTLNPFTGSTQNLSEKIEQLRRRVRFNNCEQTAVSLLSKGPLGESEFLSALEPYKDVREDVLLKLSWFKVIKKKSSSETCGEKRLYYLNKDRKRWNMPR